MSFTKESIIERSKEVIASEVENELVMMSLENGKYYGIDSIGGDIWKMVETPKTFGKICEELMKTYAVDESTCEQDVIAFLNQLKEQSLITVNA